MEHFDNKARMIESLKKRRLTITGHDIYSQDPIEYAGTWDYKNRPQPGKENATPVIVDLIRKYRKEIL